MTVPQSVEAIRILKGGISLLDHADLLDGPARDRVLTAALGAFQKEHDAARSLTLFRRWSA